MDIVCNRERAILIYCPYVHPVGRRTRTTAWQQQKKPSPGCTRFWLRCQRRRQATRRLRMPCCTQHRPGQRPPSLGQQGSLCIYNPSLHHCVAPVGAASAKKRPMKTYGGLRGPMCTSVAACVQESRGQPAAAKPALRSRGLAVEHARRGGARVGVTPLRSRPQCRSVLSW